MLAHPYGFTRVMSSFRWPRYFENGKVGFLIAHHLDQLVMPILLLIYFKPLLCSDR